MNDSEFHALADHLYQLIEERIDECGVDIDYETSGKVMTLEFENGSQMIINRQEPLHQIWLAAKSGGFHFDYKEGRWIDNRNNRELSELMAQCCSEQAGEPVELGELS
ncbi:iron donor protein CyaY [Dongshaea marina]|uniref:iron donor protein CyaY n=1 Tax=Dongshaea marina TaxID=2047966 RepID=UPI000D3EDEED|nr:iron donor protein CyaY [Dongshaea marina]